MFETVRAPHQLTRCLLPAQLTDWHTAFPFRQLSQLTSEQVEHIIGLENWNGTKTTWKNGNYAAALGKVRKNEKCKSQSTIQCRWHLRQTGAHFSLAFCWWVESGKSVKANIFQNCPRLIIGCQHSSAAATIKNQDTMVTYHAWRHCSSNGAVW